MYSAKACSTRFIKWVKLLFFVWSGPEEPRAYTSRIGLIDFFILILAVLFPWSTTATAVLLPVILVMMLIAHGPREMIEQLKQPACVFPVAILALAFVGMAWADGVPWSDRLHGLEKAIKLLWFVPVFLHFQKTSRATSVFAANVASNLLLLGFSFLVFFSPELARVVKPHEPGIPLKNYIDQSQAFTFIAVVFLALAAEALRSRHWSRAIGSLAISAAFLSNLVFVNVARTAFVYLPAMLALLVLRFTRTWLSLPVLAGFCALAAALWAVSPNLQSKIMRLSNEVNAFESNSTTVNGYPAGGAERLEFWRKSIGFIRSAPIIGHGTGSAKILFAAEAAGKTGIMAKIVDNPHNQTLAVAIQWGLIGCILLYAMWSAHLWLFREGLADQPDHLLRWIGLLAVVQNLVSSLLNSHLFDFYPGWLYLLAVAIVGGQLQRKRNQALSTLAQVDA